MRFRRLLALLAVFVLLIAACGGDDDDSSSADDGDGEPTQDIDRDADSDDGPADSDSTEIPDDVDVGECGFVVELFESFDAIPDDSMFGGSDGMATMAQGFANVAKNAPSEIRDQFETLAEIFGAVSAEMADIDIDFSDPEAIDPAAFESVEIAMQGLGDPSFQAASEDIAEWMQNACPELGDLAFDMP